MPILASSSLTVRGCREWAWPALSKQLGLGVLCTCTHSFHGLTQLQEQACYHSNMSEPVYIHDVCMCTCAYIHTYVLINPPKYLYTHVLTMSLQMYTYVDSTLPIYINLMMQCPFLHGNLFVLRTVLLTTRRECYPLSYRLSIWLIYSVCLFPLKQNQAGLPWASFWICSQ